MRSPVSVPCMQGLGLPPIIDAATSSQAVSPQLTAPSGITSAPNQGEHVAPGCSSNVDGHGGSGCNGNGSVDVSVSEASILSSLGLGHDDAWLTKIDKMGLLKQHSAVKPPHPHPIKRLPRGTKPVKLVGEGSANAVFQLKVPRGKQASTDLNGLLLRVAKVPSLTQPSTFNYLSQQEFYLGSIKPLLSNYAVKQELVILHNSAIVDELNTFLQAIDHCRKAKFRGTFVGQTDWGFLVEDMRPPNAKEYVLVEFKPKWLSQSPSAPPDAVRCRQCAMELRSLVLDPSGDRLMPENRPCPLALDSRIAAPSHVSSPFRIAPKLAAEGGDVRLAETLRQIGNHAAIQKLRLQQEHHDPKGPLNAKATDAFIIAMTLRDCTCFARIHRSRRSFDQLRIGDFDRKDPVVKLDRWRQAEQDLIDGGFYSAEWILCCGSCYRPPTLCALEFSSPSRSKLPRVLNILDQKELKNAAPDEGATGPTSSDGTVLINSQKTDALALHKLLERFNKGVSTELESLSAQPPRGQAQ